VTTPSVEPQPFAFPLRRVLVMEDRAQIERRGEIDLPGGRTQLLVTGLPLVAVDRSLKVEVQGATLVDARFVRRWREKPAAADAGPLEARVRALGEELVMRQEEAGRLGIRAEMLEQTRLDLLRGVAEGAGAGRDDRQAWQESLDAVANREAETAEALRRARRDEERTRRRLEEAEAARDTATQPEPELACNLLLTIEGAGRAVVRARYLCPCAVWRPAYRATLERDDVLVEREAVVWQDTGEAWTDVALAFSTARPTLGTSPPALTADRLGLRAKSDTEKRVVAVALREEVIATAGEGGAPELPGLDDGGEARVLEASATATVPSDGQPHRVPLGRFTAKAELENVCAAEQGSLVSLVARFPNASGEVLLAGPVQLLRGSGLVGRSLLGFVAPGETVKLSFGSDDGLRVQRELVVTTDESRLTSRRTKRHTVRLFVSNAGPRPARLFVEERLPVSEVEEVRVELVAKECRPAAPEVSQDGIARIPFDLAANATREARLVWELTASGKVAGI
jgi:uncharacterized protein (TIGR02231 family)